MDARAGNWPEASRKFNRAITLNRQTISDVIDIYLNDANRPDLLMEPMGDDYLNLIILSGALRARGETVVSHSALSQAIALLKQRCASPAASIDELALLAGALYQQEHFVQAAEYYRRVLLIDYGQTAIRLQRARALWRIGRLEEAKAEARTCLKLKPDFEDARSFLEELTRDSAK
jgi:tetratricopeptide (TPR) repeat protein